MLRQEYTKEELKNKTYETKKLEVNDLIKLVSEWLVDYVFRQSDFSSIRHINNK